MSTLEELTTPMTAAEVEAAIYAALAARGVRTTGWKVGAVVRTIVTGTSIVLAAFSTLQALLARSGFLEEAEGDWLALVAWYVYGVEKDLGSFASGEVTLNNAGGGVHSGDPGDLVFLNSATGATYRNTAAYSIGALETGVLVAVQAIELGEDGTAAAGAIDTLETALLGVTCSNASALVGSDPETDPALRIRCAAKLGTLSPNGPRDAYSFVARSAVNADGVSIGVTRVRTVADGFGNVAVYVATATGGVTGDVADPATDLGAIADAIHTLVEPLAVTPTVESATIVPIAVTYELWIPDVVTDTDTQVKDAVEARLVAFFSAQPIGGYSTASVRVSAIETVIGGTYPGLEVAVDVSLPASEIALAVDEAPTAGLVLGTIHRVTGGVI